MADTITVKLRKPVTVDALTFDELVLRELTVAEIVALEKAHGQKLTVEQDVQWFAVACGVSPAVISALGNRDWMRLKTAQFDLLGNVEDPEQKTSG